MCKYCGTALLVLVCFAIPIQSLRLPWMRRTTPSFHDPAAKAQPQWFTQEVDHFNAQDDRTWQQRYFVNDTFWNPSLGGPIFLMVGGEGAISAGYVTRTMMTVWGQKFGALLLALEHRFYGESQPFPEQTTDNLAYLSSQQALADLANFLVAMKDKYGVPDAPVVTFGGSYPGNLAAWFRIKYPFLTIGSIASSAPVEATLDFYQYLDVVDSSLEDYAGTTCVSQVADATNIVESMLLSSDGRSQLQSLFQTCTALDNQLDVTTFMSNLMGNWMETVQYNDEFSPITITTLCDIMDNGTDSLANYVKVNNLFMAGQPCMSISYQEMIEQLANSTPITQGVGPRAWTYQTCAEFGYFQSTDSDNQPFGNLVPLSYYTDMCTDLGWNFTIRINETNRYYGGNHPTGTSKVVFVNGSVDPWHALSVTHDLGKLKAIVIDGTAHCADMSPYKPSDPIGLASAQQRIGMQIRDWLDEAF